MFQHLHWMYLYLCAGEHRALKEVQEVSHAPNVFTTLCCSGDSNPLQPNPKECCLQLSALRHRAPPPFHLCAKLKPRECQLKVSNTLKEEFYSCYFTNLFHFTFPGARPGWTLSSKKMSSHEERAPLSSPGGQENGSGPPGGLKEKEPPRIVPQVFARRWFMVLLFATYSLSNAYQWIHLNIIGDVIKGYYNQSIPGNAYQQQVRYSNFRDWSLITGRGGYKTGGGGT